MVEDRESLDVVGVLDENRDELRTLMVDLDLDNSFLSTRKVKLQGDKEIREFDGAEDEIC